MTSADDLPLYRPLNRLSKPRVPCAQRVEAFFLRIARGPGVATRRTLRRPSRAAAVW
ncbi:hypothetical protein [Burkholderia metallica]|uniref:hypothetical protein n=1 Tax=Burkholderia metallica TaxID=488729 RepID=UPI00158EB4F7|nr:hypothetical protein [Burkholderia metallica]